MIGEAFAHGVQKQHGLFTATAVLARHARQRGIDFGQAVGAAARLFPVKLQEHIQAGLVVLVVAIEYRHQHRGVQEGLRRTFPKFWRSRSSRILRRVPSVTEAGSGWPVRNTQMPRSFCKGTAPRTGRTPDLFAYGFELEGVAWTELQIIAEGLGDDDATRSIEGQLGGHNAMSRVGGPSCQWH